MTNVSLQFIENSLYNNEVWARMNSGRWWRVRRNGQTKTWKTRVGDFRIPLKAGMYAHGEITHSSRVALISDSDWRSADFVIALSDPNSTRP